MLRISFIFLGLVMWVIFGRQKSFGKITRLNKQFFLFLLSWLLINGRSFVSLSFFVINRFPLFLNCFPLVGLFDEEKNICFLKNGGLFLRLCLIVGYCVSWRKYSDFSIKLSVENFENTCSQQNGFQFWGYDHLLNFYFKFTLLLEHDYTFPNKLFRTIFSNGFNRFRCEWPHSSKFANKIWIWPNFFEFQIIPKKQSN